MNDYTFDEAFWKYNSTEETGTIMEKRLTADMENYGKPREIGSIVELCIFLYWF